MYMRQGTNLAEEETALPEKPILGNLEGMRKRA
jgi:hypothetical protein